MHYKLILGLGSNYDAERNIQMAEERLHGLFPAIRFSRTMQTIAEGMPPETPDYLNAIAICETSLPYPALRAILKAMERSQGRTDVLKRQGLVPLDLDILQHGSLRYKPLDWQRSYNIQLIKEINP